jgi:uncharacterized protein (TIGR02145 family)
VNGRDTEADTIREVLTNNTSAPIEVTYHFFLEHDGCDNEQDVKVFVNPVLLPAINITGNTAVCAGESVTLSAVITNGGSSPVRQWVVNDEPVTGATHATFTYIPSDGDVVSCELTANATCAAPTSVTSPEVTMTVVDLLASILLLTDTLDAYRFMPIDLSRAVDMQPGYTYTYYANSDGTGRIDGSIVTFNPPKNDYYVTASNGACESPISKIILKDPCPATTEDFEGHIYKVTSLAGLCWTENLRSTIYTCSEEDPILFAKVYTCAGCPEQLDTIYGLLYDWYSAVATEPANCICPAGFHLPSKEEWSRLEKYPASYLRSTDYWLDPPGHGTDNYGWDARPAGWYNGALDRFENLYGFAGWWASDDVPGTSTAKYFSISYYCDVIQGEVKNKGNGLSVRCVKSEL